MCFSPSSAWFDVCLVAAGCQALSRGLGALLSSGFFPPTLLRPLLASCSPPAHPPLKSREGEGLGSQLSHPHTELPAPGLQFTPAHHFTAKSTFPPHRPACLLTPALLTHSWGLISFGCDLTGSVCLPCGAAWWRFEVKGGITCM